MLIPDVDQSQFVFAPFRDIKIISPIEITAGHIAGGIYMYYHQFSVAHQLRQQFDSQSKDNPVILCSHPSMTSLYVLDPISSYLPEKVPNSVNFSGIIEYNPRINSSFWWETDYDAKSYEYPLTSNEQVTKHITYGLSLNPGFIVSIIGPKQKKLILTLMGPENGIIGRSMNIPMILKQFNYICPYWPELDMSFEVTGPNNHKNITYKIKGLETMSNQPRIICVEKDFDATVMLVSETHIPNNKIIMQLESLQ